MKVKTLEIAKSIKVSHDYNSVSSHFGMTVEIEDGDDLDEVTKKVSDLVSKQVRKDASAQLKVLIKKQLLR